MSLNDDPLERALLSLEGLSVGDAFGERYFIHPTLVERFIQERIQFDPPWPYTDDAEMALSIVADLRAYDGIDQDELAQEFALRYDPRRGYGPAMHQLLPRLGGGLDWEEGAQELFGGSGSFGNGAAMRVAPLGAYFADDLEAVVEHAERSARVTHAHPEGIAGAVATALGAAWAWRLKDARPKPADFIDRVLADTPDSRVKEGVFAARDLPPGTSVAEAVSVLGNGSQVSAQDTVPFVLWCAAQSLTHYEEALWLTVSGLGDRDTTCAMVGGIVALSAGRESIPVRWREAREPLPEWLWED